MSAKEYICDLCGAPYTQMLIDYPMHCSVECAVRASLAAAAVDAKAAPRTWIGTKQPAPTRH